MRQLVTLRQISEINPIPYADAIEAVRVDGWVCVAKKGEFRVGDSCLYFEIDSILPVGNPLFSFLTEKSSKNYPTENCTILHGHRLKTIRLRGQISQGLVLPVPEYLPDDKDLTEYFGVQKYEMPIHSSMVGMARGAYPGWLPKTDQERIQNIRLVPGEYIVEEKMEGSSMTVFWHPETGVGVTSRNINLKLDQEGNNFVNFAKASGLLDGVANMGEHLKNSLAVRMELCGPGIQGNIYNFQKTCAFIFDVFLGDRYLDAQARLGLTTIIIKSCDDVKDVHIVRSNYWVKEGDPDSILEFADGPSAFGQTKREGLVFKNLADGNISFKAISNQYLLNS